MNRHFGDTTIEDYDDDNEEQRPRRCYYLFEHQFLPQALFAEPKQFMEMLRSSDAPKYLAGGWSQTAIDTGEPSYSRDGRSIAVGFRDLAGLDSAVIAFPKPERSSEAYYAIVVHGDDATDRPWRYLTIEHNYGYYNSAKLCEWTEDGKHVDLGLPIRPKDDDFMEVVAGHLGAGLEKDAPATAEPETAEAVQEAGPRLQPCVFAFYLLPEAAVMSPEGMVGALSQNSGALMRALWQSSADICNRVTPGGRLVAHPPSAEFVGGEEGWAVVITMPEPVAAPEPSFIALVPAVEGVSSITGSGLGIYFLEKPVAGDIPLMTYLSSTGDHGILGAIRPGSGMEFLSLAARMSAGESVEFGECDGEAQRALYREIHHRITGQ
jgi:hypothetical protein